jgi:hypothetical protein
MNLRLYLCHECAIVLQGLAVVWVDDKWRARLGTEDYDRPRDLVRKGARFKALCAR